VKQLAIGAQSAGLSIRTVHTNMWSMTKNASAADSVQAYAHAACGRWWKMYERVQGAKNYEQGSRIQGYEDSSDI